MRNTEAQGKAGQEIRVEAVEAYDRIAKEFGRLSEARRAYLDSVEELVIEAVPEGARSLLDVGAGDGRRARRIAEGAGIEEVVLLEPSSEMRKLWPAGIRGWAVRAEELGGRHDVSFDVITCLWNVLGHVFPPEKRVETLRSLARLLTPAGLIFIDVNHRYNARQYGFVRTALRMMLDKVRPNERNGDVVVRWHVDGTTYAAEGHVFTQREFRRIADAAGLGIRKMFTVDYETGQIRHSRFGGNPLYVLGRA